MAIRMEGSEAHLVGDWTESGVAENLDSRYATSLQKRGRLLMKFDKIKEVSMQHYIKMTKKKKTDLIRAIQLSEGNQDCFNSNFSGECGQERCVWRDDCV